MVQSPGVQKRAAKKREDCTRFARGFEIWAKKHKPFCFCVGLRALGWERRAPYSGSSNHVVRRRHRDFYVLGLYGPL